MTVIEDTQPDMNNSIKYHDLLFLKFNNTVMHAQLVSLTSALH